MMRDGDDALGLPSLVRVAAEIRSLVSGSWTEPPVYATFRVKQTTLDWLKTLELVPSRFNFEMTHSIEASA